MNLAKPARSSPAMAPQRLPARRFTSIAAIKSWACTNEALIDRVDLDGCVIARTNICRTPRVSHRYDRRHPACRRRRHVAFVKSRRHSGNRAWRRELIFDHDAVPLGARDRALVAEEYER